LEAKSLGDLREIAKLQGVKSITKYRKSELVDIIMAGGKTPSSSDTSEEQENEDDLEAQAERESNERHNAEPDYSSQRTQPAAQEGGYRRSSYSPRPYQHRQYYDNRSQGGG